MVCVNGVTLLGENMGAASLVASEKFGLEVNTEKKKEKKYECRFIVITSELNGGNLTTLTWLTNALKLSHSSNTRKAINKSKLRWEENKSS